MDDDGDDDDCGYLRDRTGERERGPMPALPCLRPNGSSILDDREGRKQHPSPWGVFFSIQRRRQGIL